MFFFSALSYNLKIDFSTDNMVVFGPAKSNYFFKQNFKAHYIIKAFTPVKNKIQKWKTAVCLSPLYL